MRVLLLNQIPEVNNKYTFSLARVLLNEGVDIRVCGIATDNVEEYSDVVFLNIFEPYSKINGLYNKTRSYIKSWKRVIKYCEKEGIDIIHTQWNILSPVDFLFHRNAQKKNIKIVTTIHDLLPFDKKIYDYYFHKKIYVNTNWIINQALINENRLINEFNIDKNKITYIPHGHYMEFAEEATKEESRAYLNVSKEKEIVLFFGQIKKVKGVDVLIDSIDIVRKKHPNVLCIIAGKVWKDDFSVYENQIKEKELEDYIRTIIKFIPDSEIKYYFNAANIVALPYREIFQSGVVLLGFAYEKPIVATTEGEFLNIVKNKETGLLVKAGSPSELAEAIIWYLDNPEKAMSMAKEGKRDISNRLSWKKIARDTKCLYEKVLNTINI